MCCFSLAKPSGLSLEQPVRLQIKDHADHSLRVGFVFCMGVSNLTITAQVRDVGQMKILASSSQRKSIRCCLREQTCYLPGTSLPCPRQKTEDLPASDTGKAQHYRSAHSGCGFLLVKHLYVKNTDFTETLASQMKKMPQSNITILGYKTFTHKNSEIWGKV